ncbi:MAG: hypothetical protein JWQ17_2990 [Tardiphaga sp.]|jgi:hypothetical protein|nr:hypothetical protein [Tardiphaga sp.]
MRLASANLFALAIYVCALLCCFAFTLGFSFSGAVIYMVLAGPAAFALGLIYFVLLRARTAAIVVLAVLSIALGFAFLNHNAFMKFVVFVDQKDFANREVALFRQWMSNGNGDQWIRIVWAGVTAALAHHLVYAALNPRVVKESVSHG